MLASEWYELDLKPLKFDMAKEEQKERILSEMEIRRLIVNSQIPLRYIIMVAINTGMRKSEILNLEWLPNCKVLPFSGKIFFDKSVKSLI